MSTIVDLDTGQVLGVVDGRDHKGVGDWLFARSLWAKRLWRCPDPGCPRTTFSEKHPLAGPRAKLTARAVNWATHALQRFDTSVSALATSSGCPGTPRGTQRPGAGSLTRAGSRV